MSMSQYLRWVWLRKRLALAIFVLVGLGGSLYALQQPRQFSADALLMLDVRPDPLLGALGSAASMATQIEVLKTEKVAARAAQLLGLDKDAASIARWQKATGGKVPIERFLAGRLQLGLTVDSVRGSNLIGIGYASDDKDFAMAAANAFARAGAAIAIEMRVEPARESAEWFGVQTRALRANLEQAQAKLSSFQQQKGIVSSDEKVGLELARLTALEAQFGLAQAEFIESEGRVRSGGSAASPDVQKSALAQNLFGQLSALESKLADVSASLGSSHPQRERLELEIAGLRQQLAAEYGRVGEGSTLTRRVSAQKVEALRGLVEAQKRQVLSLRSQRDEMAVLLHDVENAQRAYEAASQRAGQLTLESQNNQAGVRLLSPAVESVDVSGRKLLARIVASLAAGLGLGAGAAILLEHLDRRVRSPGDLIGVAGVPLLGVLRQAGASAPVFRRLPVDGRLPRRVILPMSGPQP